jgi:hypothetical protein
MEKVSLPEDFDPQGYLLLNPDVRKAGVDPVQHYLEFGYREQRAYKRPASSLRPKLDSPYEFDGLFSIHNHDFMEMPEFIEAYNRGIEAAGTDYKWFWRVHIGLWAARSAIRIEGDFVECGVNRGFLSSAIMKSLDWDRQGRTFYLLDTFNGTDMRYISEIEKAAGVIERGKKELESGFYTSNRQAVEKNFMEWVNKRIIVGSIPETLTQIVSTKLAFVHLDLNCSPPEVASLETLWGRVERGGLVLLDDYAYYGYQSQKEGVDTWAQKNGVPVASLPTGQGLMIKA